MALMINNKKESREYIVQHNLNRTPEIFINHDDFEKARAFIETNYATLYVIRDADRSSAPYYYFDTFEKCKEKMVLFKGQVIIAVSVNSYKNKILLGAIEVKGDSIRFCATTDSTQDHRTMYEKPKYDFVKQMDDGIWNDIPGFDEIYCYIYDHHLLDYTVEFTVYDRPVGTNSETVLINEVRNY